MAKKRTARLNSLLKEVISDIIRKHVRNPHINELLTITRVDITTDLHHAKVYVAVIGTDEVKHETLKALQSAAGFIAVNASKEVVMRYFPALTFKLDDSVDKHMRIEKLLTELNQEMQSRGSDEISSPEIEETSSPESEEIPSHQNESREEK